jgi:signal transduction histidine kinase
VGKHAGASRVTVRLYVSADLTTLEIEDDGVGFEAGRPPKQGRMGLSGMKRRVELLGGEFRVVSSAGGPTTVIASLRAWRPDDT